ncbi:hypothetical protein F4167_05845 [Candidatus Poribacteria bacterium]|nr:hypothetical protein [Candidatus Poribacteria bacterium]
MEYVVIYEKGDSSYGAYVPDLPGCITVGETLEETQILIQEAIEFHIEGLQEDGDDVPQPSLNLPIQYDIPNLGIHKVVENYVHNDDPAIFSCKHAAGHLYLVTVGENDQDKTWLRVGISKGRFNLIRSGSINLRDAFTDSENGYLLRIKVPHDDPTQSSPEVILPNEIPEDLLPFPGERLGLKTETLPALSSPEELASSKNREILNLTPNFSGIFRTEAPIDSLGMILTGFQKVINRIGAHFPDSNSKKKSEDIRNPFGISMLEVGAGSFDIRLASTELVDIFKSSNLGNAIEEFLKLFNAGSDRVKLKPLIEQFGPKIAKDYTNLLKSLSESVTDTRLTWTSPHPDLGGTAQLSKAQMLEVIDILETIEKETSETIKIRGTLVGLSLRSKSFQIETDDENYYERDYFRGKITDEAIDTEPIRNATLSQTYIAEIQGFVEIGETKDENDIKFTLLSLSQ